MNTQFLKSYRIPTIALLLLGGSISIAPVSAKVLPGQPDVYPRDSVVFGQTYSDWSAGWQQWATSLPYKKHPLFDTADCSEGQSGPVWFLGGRFCSTDNQEECSSQPAVRECTIPSDKALYFPILNFACLNQEADKGYCGDGVGSFITQMRAFIGDGIDQTVDLAVTVDGKKIKGDLKNKFRVKSPVYTAVLPEDNLLNGIGYTDINAGTYWGVDDGIYIMLKPLPKGKHTINFTGRFPQYDFTLDFNYNLTVE